MERETERLDTIAQRLVHAPRFVWRPGMLARDESGFWMRGKPAPGSALFPDLLDPSTIGCMLATVLELYRDALGVTFVRDSDHRWRAIIEQRSDDRDENLFADSFAELLALLIEAAE